jgi:hypothetical protein
MGMPEQHKTRFSWITRDRFLLTFGAAGVAYETVIEKADKPTLLILFAACLGFPVFLKADENKRTQETKKETEKVEVPDGQA